MTDQIFHEGRARLLAGDCLARLKDLPDCSVDSVCTDPPYHLVSIVRRFGSENAAPALSAAERRFAKSGGADRQPGTDQYGRLSRGFMGKTWDGGDIAFRVELWAEVFRVLKPGGHVLAFSGTRTYHRMACAIEDAGFEVRDCLFWCYGSGFPKNHDVSKAIDKSLGAERTKVRVDAADVRNPKATGGGRDGLDGASRPWIELALERGYHEKPGDVPATDAAREWQGWGTALKPALEPICLARKPLSEATIAANVLRWGTGAINIDGCRVETDETITATRNVALGSSRSGVYGGADKPGVYEQKPGGRHPANLVHDGSPEVLAGFPETISGGGPAVGTPRSKVNTYGEPTVSFSEPYGSNSGSAARFFYSAKADADDRLASKHPTVKPVDLMRWLVRLVTPPGGTVLDPFAGTGTTGHAALLEGFNAILIEREEEYRADIARRMSLVYAGPTERSHAIVKAKGEADEHEALPLFGAKQ